MNRFALCLVVLGAMLSGVAPLGAWANGATGDTPDDAIALDGLSSPVAGAFTAGDYRDYYSIHLSAGDFLDIDVEGDPVDADSADVVLYRGVSNFEFDIVAQSLGSAGSESIEWLVPPSADGTYTVEVKPGFPLDATYEMSWSTAAPDVVRLWGKDRYETSYAISRSTFATATAAVVASGADFPDALAASGLAGALECPILLTKPTSIPDGLTRELTRLGVDKIYVVGGTAAISAGVYDQLSLRAPSIERLSGRDRYETAKRVADEIATPPPSGLGIAVGPVFVVRGTDFADALAVSPFAYARSMPVLLTRTGVLSGYTASFIENRNVTEAIIAGGTAAVSDGVAAEIEGLKSGTTTERWSGSDRYSTAVDVATSGIDRGWLGDWERVGLATGQSFPDALGGGVSCGAYGSPLLLSRGGSLSGSTASAIDTNGVQRALLFGGESALSATVKADVEGIVK